MRMKKHVIGQRQEGLTRFDSGDDWKGLLICLGMSCLSLFEA